jgi:hypothetical protein
VSVRHRRATQTRLTGMLRVLLLACLFPMAFPRSNNSIRCRAFPLSGSVRLGTGGVSSGTDRQAGGWPVCECVESCHRALALCTGYQSYRRLHHRRHRLVRSLRLAGGGHQHLAITASVRMSLVSGHSTRPLLSYTFISSPLTWRPGKYVIKCQAFL